eukprot:scaffold101498_cov24-Tisochrysis_lutea.AAC.1
MQPASSWHRHVPRTKTTCTRTRACSWQPSGGGRWTACGTPPPPAVGSEAAVSHQKGIAACAPALG